MAGITFFIIVTSQSIKYRNIISNILGSIHMMNTSLEVEREERTLVFGRIEQLGSRLIRTTNIIKNF